MRCAPAFAAFAVLVLCSVPLSGWAQEPAAPPPSYKSTTVNPDHTVTFRFLDRGAAKVELSLEGAAEPLPMLKGQDGIWSATSKPLAPQIYGYDFSADGARRLDPKNVHVTRNLVNLSNLLEVPADVPQPWELQDVPHGEVSLHLYTSRIVTGLPLHQSEFYVYTPPGYDPRADREYPVLYLLHGYSDDASGWTAVGHANRIFDALIAKGTVKPMVVVMPLGYGEMSFLERGFQSWRTPEAVASNLSLYQQALLGEVLPRVESEYRVSKKREDRAIAGLSMGGLESLSIGLNHTDQFAYVAGMSSVAGSVDRASLATLNPKTANLKLLWIACGTEDHLIDSNREFISFLKTKEMPVTAVETPGMHTWMVWRDNLVHLTPLLFQR